MWGSSNVIYAVGTAGFVALRKATGSWQKLQSGTTLQFTDIYGATDLATGKEQILATASQNYPPGKGLFSIQGNTVKEISTNFNFPGYTTPPELFSVWFVPQRRYYIVGDGIYEKHHLTDSIWKNGPLDITKYATTNIRGTGLNDIFVVGAFGEFLHFNGARWKSFIKQTSLSNGSYSKVAVKRNLIIAVGADNARAVITIVKRQ